ncbi:Uncharacterised protein [Mycobacteroides abscessus subsp. abscessus]|nr:Uncharacterised protein [Mycobacteroides abscessus subsp. abscessus]
MRSPSATASSSGLSSTAPTPLPKIVPSARTSNGRQYPLGDAIDPGS